MLFIQFKKKFFSYHVINNMLKIRRISTDCSTDSKKSFIFLMARRFSMEMRGDFFSFPWKLRMGCFFQKNCGKMQKLILQQHTMVCFDKSNENENSIDLVSGRLLYRKMPDNSDMFFKT